MLLLWDIDGTLINGAELAATAFLAALRAVYELPTVTRISYAGKTDRQIVHETLAHHDWPADYIHERLPAFEQAYLAEFQRRAAELSLHILPGVESALQHLAPVATHALLTGNLEPTARLKLDAADLSHWFNWRWSAFGSDHRDRNALVAIALKRATHHGWRGHRDQVVVIGDTPHDVACARAGGVRVIAVATGSFSRAELLAVNPDAVLDDLSDLSALQAALATSS